MPAVATGALCRLPALNVAIFACIWNAARTVFARAIFHGSFSSSTMRRVSIRFSRPARNIVAASYSLDRDAANSGAPV
jgi:hypothetical protein